MRILSQHCMSSDKSVHIDPNGFVGGKQPSIKSQYLGLVDTGRLHFAWTFETPAMAIPDDLPLDWAPFTIQACRSDMVCFSNLLHDKSLYYLVSHHLCALLLFELGCKVMAPRYFWAHKHSIALYKWLDEVFNLNARTCLPVDCAKSLYMVPNS